MSIARNRSIMASQRRIKYSAFCAQLNRTITTEELWHLVFEPGYGQRRYSLSELSLKCSHPSCQALLTAQHFCAHDLSSEVRFRRVRSSPAHGGGCPLTSLMPKAFAYKPTSIAMHSGSLPPQIRSRSLYEFKTQAEFNQIIAR